MPYVLYGSLYCLGFGYALEGVLHALIYSLRGDRVIDILTEYNLRSPT
jgi:hypothetical protein